MIVGGPHPPHLAAPPVPLAGKVPFGRTGGFGAARVAGEIHVHQQIPLGEVMLMRPAVRPEELIHGRLHLGSRLDRAGIQRILEGRLFGTGGAPERRLQRRIGAQDPLDVSHSHGARQDADKTVIQLVDGRVLHRFLRNPHAAADGREQIQSAQLRSERGETGARRRATFVAGCGRLVHGGKPPGANGSSVSPEVYHLFAVPCAATDPPFSRLLPKTRWKRLVVLSTRRSCSSLLSFGRKLGPRTPSAWSMTWPSTGMFLTHPSTRPTPAVWPHRSCRLAGASIRLSPIPRT